MYGGRKPPLEAVGVRAEHMVEDEQVVVAELLRGLRIVADGGRVRADLGLREDDAKFHSCTSNPAACASDAITAAPSAPANPGHGASSTCTPNRAIIIVDRPYERRVVVDEAAGEHDERQLRDERARRRDLRDVFAVQVEQRGQHIIEFRAVRVAARELREVRRGQLRADAADAVRVGIADHRIDAAAVAALGPRDHRWIVERRIDASGDTCERAAAERRAAEVRRTCRPCTAANAVPVPTSASTKSRGSSRSGRREQQAHAPAAASISCTSTQLLRGPMLDARARDADRAPVAGAASPRASVG